MLGSFCLQVCKSIEKLTKQVSWPDDVYSSVVDLATLHLTSFDQSIRANYGRLLMNIPLNIVVQKLNKLVLLSDNKVLPTRRCSLLSRDADAFEV